MTNRRPRQQYEELPRYLERPTPWHLDKTVQLGMLGTMLVLAASGITAAVKLSDRVDDTVKDIAAVQTEIKEEITARQAEIKENDKARTDMSAHFASIDVTLQDMKSMMFQSSQRAMQLVMPSSGNSGNSQQPIILQQAPAAADKSESK